MNSKNVKDRTQESLQPDAKVDHEESQYRSDIICKLMMKLAATQDANARVYLQNQIRGVLRNDNKGRKINRNQMPIETA